MIPSVFTFIFVWYRFYINLREFYKGFGFIMFIEVSLTCSLLQVLDSRGVVTLTLNFHGRWGKDNNGNFGELCTGRERNTGNLTVRVTSDPDRKGLFVV